jgi:prefoldin subunit 5
MSKSDADVQRLYQQVKSLEEKVNQLTKLITRIEKIEAYINHLHSDLKVVGSLINEIQSHVEPILKALDGLGSFVLKAVNSVIAKFT